MNCEDQFEHRLQRQPPRSIPPAWRSEILNAARRAASCRMLPMPAHRSFLSTLNPQLSTILWPHPRAWAGLAAVWLVILALNFAAGEPSPQEVAHRADLPAQQLRQIFQQHEQVLADLVGPIDRPDPPLQKPVAPKPRSQRREDFMNA